MKMGEGGPGEEGTSEVKRGETGRGRGERESLGGGMSSGCVNRVSAHMSAWASILSRGNSLLHSGQDA